MVCPILPEKQEAFYKKVYKDLKTLESTKAPFVLDDYVKSIFDLVAKSDPTQALVYAQITPSNILEAAVGDLRDYLTDNGLDLNEVNKLSKSFRDINKVSQYFGQVAEPIEVIKEAKKQVQEEVNEAPVPLETYDMNMSLAKFPAKPPTGAATTGQSAKGATPEEVKLNILDERVIPYENFQREIIERVLTSGSDSSYAAMPGLPDGVYLTAVLGSSIDKDHYHPRTKQKIVDGELSLETFNNTVLFAITNAEGEFLYFNADNEPTSEANGTLMLYNMRRSNPEKLQSVTEVAKSQGVTTQVAAKMINDSLENNEAVRAYLRKNPTAKVKAVINGGSKGYVPINKNKPVSISEIDFQGNTPEFINPKIIGAKRNFIVMKLNGIDEAFKLNEKLITPEDAEMIATFLTSKVYVKGPGGTEILLTDKKKTEYLLPILFKGHIKRLQSFNAYPNAREQMINHLTKPFAGPAEITKDRAVGQRIWKLTDPDINDAPVGIAPYPVVEAIVGGKPSYHWLQRVTYNISDLSVEKGSYDKIELKARPDGSQEMTTNLLKPTNYDEFIKQHATVQTQLNDNNQIVSMNPYFTYKYDETDLAKVFDTEAAIKKDVDAVKKAPVPTKQTPIDKKKSTPKEVIKKLKSDDDGYYKRYFQKISNVEATEKQLITARDWWPTSPLSKVISFETMFQIINTRNPNSVAQWTTNGIVLFKGSDFSDIYYEAWHGFTQLFLTTAEKAKLYGEARKRSGKFTDYEGKRVKYSDATDLQLEEVIAEEFREYMLKANKPKGFIGTIFKYIKDLLKALFGTLTVKDMVLDPEATYLNELFEKLRVGNISEFTFDMRNANFNVLNKGLLRITNDKEKKPSLNLTDSKMVNDTIDYLISDSVNQINAGVRNYSDWQTIKDDYSPVFPDIESAKFSAFLKAQKMTAPSQREYVTAAQLLRDEESRSAIYTSVLNKLTRSGGVRDKLLQKVETAEEGPMKDLYQANLDTLDYAITEFGDPKVDFDKLKGKGTIAYNLKKSPFLTVEEKAEIYEALEEDEKDQGWENHGNKTPIEQMFDPVITSFLKGLYEVDKDGNPILNELGVPKPANFKFVVNRLSHVLGNGVDKDQMMQILQKRQESEPLFTQILNKLGPSNTSNWNAQNLHRLLWKSFNLSSVKLIQLSKYWEEEAGFSTTFGVASSPVASISRDWESQFALSNNDTIKRGADGISYLDLDAFFAKHPTFVEGQELEILHSMGMMITDDAAGTVRKRLRSADNYYGTSRIYDTLKAVQELKKLGAPVKKLTSIKKIIRNFQPLSPVKNKLLKSNEGRYANILDLDAKNNETIGHTVNNAKNDPQQDITIPFFLSIVKDEINSVTSWDELMNIRGMEYLARNRNYLARYSRILNSIFDMETGKRRRDKNGIDIRGHRYVEFKFENFSGIGLIHDGYSLGGAAITELNKLDALIAYRDSFVMAGKPGGPGHGAKSSTFLYSVKTVAKSPSTTHTGQYYVDIAQFLRTTESAQSEGRTLANGILLDYINGEVNRIHAFNNLAEDDPARTIYKMGDDFSYFHDILSRDSKDRLLAIEEVKADPNVTLEQYFYNTKDPLVAQLYEQITSELNTYFNVQIKNAKAMFDKVPFTDMELFKKVLEEEKFSDITYDNQSQIHDAILEAFVYNSWMHSFEGHAIFYGDNAQFEGQTRSKRDGAMASPGIQADYSQSGLAFINGLGKNATPYGYSKLNPNHATYKHPRFTDTQNVAVMDDPTPDSKYIGEIREALEEEIDAIQQRDISSEEKFTLVEASIAAFQKMKIADSAGVIAFDSYRKLRISNGTWTDPNLEIFYQKEVSGEGISLTEASLMFRTMKLQYSGPLDIESLPAMANHKFMVVPLIPSLVKGKNWEIFHNQMVAQNIDYALFKSGSKTATVTKNGKADPFYLDADKKIIAFDKPDFKFTTNKVFLKYLKEQTATSDEYSENSTTSRQLRTLAITDLISAGVPIDYNKKIKNEVKREKEWNKMDEAGKKKASPIYKLIKDYEANLAAKTKFIEDKLKKDMGWVDGDATGNVKKLLTFVRTELERKDLPEHLVDYIEYDQTTNKPLRELSLSLNSEDIEGLLANLVSKRIVNQKSKGQTYYMVSDTGHEFQNQPSVLKTEKDIEDMIEAGDVKAIGKKKVKYDKITYNTRQQLIDKLNENLKDFVSPNNELPFYVRGSIDPVTGERRTTTMAGARIALHGDFKKLLFLRHPDGRRVGTRERLNKLIRSESWLSKGHNRDMISFVGIRIPGQGLDSVDVVQVYEFLDEKAGPVIMMHPEVVAKVGADYDNDKFPAMTPNIMTIGGEVVYARNYTSSEGLDLYNKVVKAKVELAKLENSEGIRIDIKKRIHGPKGARVAYKTEDLFNYNDLIQKIFKLEGVSIDFAEMSSLLDVAVEEELISERKILPYDEFIKKINGVKAIENKIINNIKDLTLLPQNYVQLVKPNGTFLLRPTTENILKPLVADANYEQNVRPENTGFSPTRIMEIPYNLNKVAGITAAQQALGITMVFLRWSPLFNRVGFRLNPSYLVKNSFGDEIFRKQLKLYFPHNSYKVGDESAISLSHIYNVVGTRISDLLSQLSNGNVDAETDDWASNMQANREATPVITQMLKAGVDQEIVQYFVSNPLIRKYLQEQREVKGPHSRQLGKEPRDGNNQIVPNFYRGKALRNLMIGNKYGFNMDEGFIPNFAKNKLVMNEMLNEYMTGDVTLETKNVTRTNKIITKEEVKANPRTLYIFGDNDARKGLGGQAKQMRGEANAIGISTKKVPSNKPEAFKTDAELEENMNIITADIDAVIEQWESGNYDKLVIPPLGVGLAKLPTKAPETYRFLESQLNRLEAVASVKTRVATNAVEFTKENLLNAVKDAKGKEVGVNYKPTNLDRAALLHYIDIEEMAKATRDITMRLTGDSKRSKTVSSAWNRKALIEELANNGMFDYNLINKLLSNSPIASFDTNQFIIDAVQPLFSLRDHPALLKFVGRKQKAEAFRDIPLTTGDVEKFGTSLVNDFIGGYIYQNMLRGFNIDSAKDYKGFGVRTPLKIEPLKSLKFGIDVVDRVMHVDKAQIKLDYEVLTNGQRYPEGEAILAANYKKRGLAPVETEMFSSLEEYSHFVFEREYLRSITSAKAKEVYKTSEAYEEFLKNEALDNTFNIWKVFKSDTSYASQFQEIKDNHPDLVKKYPVLDALVVDTEKDKTDNTLVGGMKNIRLRTTTLTKDEIDIYQEQITALLNPTTPKSTDPEESKKISRFFRRMPFMAVLQSGMNTTNTFSYLKIIPQDQFYTLMKEVSDKWIKVLDKIESGGDPKALDMYYDKWAPNNSKFNYNQNRFKDYLLTQEQKEADTQKPKDTIAPETFTVVSPGIEQANLNLNEDVILDLATKNPLKVFVYNQAQDTTGSVYGTVTQKDIHVGSLKNSYGIIARATNKIGQDAAFHLSDENYDANVIQIEKDIAALKDLQAKGRILVFNSAGYAQALSGAEDITGNNYSLENAIAPRTFLYLSQRLYEEFGYINKNMMKQPEGRRIIQKSQATSDDAVREKQIACFG